MYFIVIGFRYQVTAPLTLRLPLKFKQEKEVVFCPIFICLYPNWSFGRIVSKIPLEQTYFFIKFDEFLWLLEKQKLMIRKTIKV